MTNHSDEQRQRPPAALQYAALLLAAIGAGGGSSVAYHRVSDPLHVSVEVPREVLERLKSVETWQAQHDVMHARRDSHTDDQLEAIRGLVTGLRDDVKQLAAQRHR